MFNLVHDSEPESLECADYFFEDIFSWMTKSPDMENTVIFFLADHGQKMGSFFGTPTGINENLMPHLFMLTPKKLLKKYPELDSVLSQNQNKLSTPHDLHITLKHLAVYPQTPRDIDHITYGKSLLTPLPDRDCFSCGIPNNWCLCHKWVPMPGSVNMHEIAEYVLKRLNEFVQDGKSVCKTLQLADVIETVVSDNATSGLPTFRIEFSVVSPRSMIFRAFVVQTQNGYWMDQWDITQVSRWGRFVSCNPDKVRPPIEAQFCLCK